MHIKFKNKVAFSAFFRLPLSPKSATTNENKNKPRNLSRFAYLSHIVSPRLIFQPRGAIFLKVEPLSVFFSVRDCGCHRINSVRTRASRPGVHIEDCIPTTIVEQVCSNSAPLCFTPVSCHISHLPARKTNAPVGLSRRIITVPNARLTVH